MSEFAKICVFCGSKPGARPLYQAAAKALGETMGQMEIDLVYGGGSVGLMGDLAHAVQAAGRHVTGIIPAALMTRELMGDRIGELIVVETMHERKAKMASMSDAFIALPGGFGTLDELLEIISWAQLGIHTKPIGILNTAGYFEQLIGLFDHCLAEGFIRQEHRDLVMVDTEPDALLLSLSQHTPARGLSKWMDLDET